MDKLKRHREIIKLYKAGNTTFQISAVVGVCTTTVLRHLHSEGLHPPRKNKKLSEKIGTVNVSRCSRCGGGQTERDRAADGLTPINNRLTGELEILCSECLCPDVEFKITVEMMERFASSLNSFE